MTRRIPVSAVVHGLVVTGLFWIDPLFIPLVLLGPIVVGVAAAAKHFPVRWAVVVWLVAGIGAVVSDFVVNHEDVVFHLVLTGFVVGVAAGSWWLTSRFVRSRKAVSALS